MHTSTLICCVTFAATLTGCVGPSSYQGADGATQSAGPGSSALSVRTINGTQELTAVSNFAKDLDATNVKISTPSGYKFSADRWTSGSANGTRGVEAFAEFAQQIPALGAAVVRGQAISAKRGTQRDIRKERQATARQAESQRLVVDAEANRLVAQRQLLLEQDRLRSEAAQRAAETAE